MEAMNVIQFEGKMSLRDVMTIIDSDGRNFLHHSCRLGHVEVVKLILHEKKWLDINLVDRRVTTSLVYASWRGHHEIARLLLTAGASLTG